MKGKDYFILGSKLFGIWCLFQGIVGVLAAIPTFMPPPKLGAEMGGIYTATVLVTRIVPVLFIVSGVYLLRAGNRLYEFAYPGEAEQSTEFQSKFVLFLKMLGIYLLVVYVPDLLRTASAYFVYLNAPPFYDLFREKQFTYLNAASSVGGVLLGIYLLRSGKVFVRIALKGIGGEPKNSNQDTTQQVNQGDGE